MIKIPYWFVALFFAVVGALEAMGIGAHNGTNNWVVGIDAALAVLYSILAVRHHRQGDEIGAQSPQGLEESAQFYQSTSLVDMESEEVPIEPSRIPLAKGKDVPKLTLRDPVTCAPIGTVTAADPDVSLWEQHKAKCRVCRDPDGDGAA